MFFTFNSLILLKLLYVWYEVRIHFTYFSPVWIACYASTVYWLILPFSTDLRFLLPQFSILSRWSVLSVSVPVSYCFNYDSFKINHEPDSSLHPLLLITLWISWLSLAVCSSTYILKSGFQVPQGNSDGILMEMALNI